MDERAAGAADGDIKQLGSVGAGAAFGQLQAAQMQTAKLEEIVRQTNARVLEAVEATIKGDARRALDALDRGGGRIVECPTPEARHAEIASAYVNLSPDEQRRTLVIDPSREGRDRLTDQIRAALLESGTLGEDRVTIRTLVSKGLTKAETRDVRSFHPGDVVTFGREYPDKGIPKRAAAVIAAIDQQKNTIQLSIGDRNVEWSPRQWGAQIEAFTPVERELRSGDRIEFTRNDYRLGRVNGAAAQVMKLDAEQGVAIVRADDGQSHRLRLGDAQDQHVRHGYVQTVYAAQGRTVDRVVIHAESGRTNLVDQSSIYVGISRAKSEVVLVTDDRVKLVAALHERSGTRQAAVETGLGASAQAALGL